MNNHEKLGMTPEEFLEAFQLYLRQFGSKDLLLSSATPNSYYKDFIDLMKRQKRDSKIEDIIDGV